jgi:hypothetical protein
MPKDTPEGIQKICLEWDELEKSNDRLANLLFLLQRKLPELSSRTGRTSALFLGLAIGSLPCFVAKEGGISWSLAMVTGATLMPLAIVISVLCMMCQSDGGTVYSRKKLHLFAVREAARADALWENWDSEELTVVERMVSISWELMKLKDAREETTEAAYLTALADHLRKRFLKEERQD